MIDKTAPVVSLTKVNGTTVSFPFNTNANVNSVGSSCTNGDGNVSVTLGGSPTTPATATCSAGSWTLTFTTPISAEGTYVFAASQTDAAGNTGSSGNQTVVIDKTAPVVSLTKVNGATVSFPVNTNANVNSVGGSCTNGDGDVSVTLGGSPTTPATTACSGGSWTLTLTTPITAEGTYVFAATQTDSAGNTGSSGNQTIVIDKTAPVVTLTQVNGSGVSFPLTTNQNVNSVGGSCTSGDGNVSVTLGGNPTTPASTSCSGGSWTLTLTTPISAEGTYVFAASQTDAAGNTGSSGNQTVVIDKTAPVVTIDSITPDPTNSGTTAIWHANDNGAYSVRVGGTDCSTGTVVSSGTYSTAPAAVATPIAASDLSEGSNTIRVCVTDTAANTGSAVSSVTKDTTSPIVVNVSSTKPNGTYTVGEVIPIQVEFSDP